MRFKFNILGHTVHVYGRPMTLAERARKLSKKRRKAGLCVQCGTKVKQSHIRKGKEVLYRKCKRCREMENRAKRFRNYLTKLFN